MFVRHKKYSGKAIYTALRERGILVRHFNKDPISDYNRITVGTADEMAALVTALADITKE